jgi:hypothetical protein
LRSLVFWTLDRGVILGFADAANVNRFPWTCGTTRFAVPIDADLPRVVGSTFASVNDFERQRTVLLGGFLDVLLRPLALVARETIFPDVRNSRRTSGRRGWWLNSFRDLLHFGEHCWLMDEVDPVLLFFSQRFLTEKCLEDV